jgi:hypothetical protein
LSEENVTYDVSAYEPHLPDEFPGYLIRTSRRLGMEGLPQRHGVASYHNQLRWGDCAIAAVFVNHIRWTVQLIKTDDVERPLRIGQIKTRLNEAPSTEVRKAIHDALGFELPTPHPSSVSEDLERSLYMDTLRCLLPVLRQHRIEHVDVYFDGSGDDGSIEWIEYRPRELEFDTDIMALQHFRISSQFEDGKGVKTRELTTSAVSKALIQLTDAYLEETGVNGYDNAGGLGQLEIDVAGGEVTLTIDCRYTHSNPAFVSQQEIETGEEL